MGRIVIAAYRPKPGREDVLRAAVEKHVEVLRAEELLTDRPSVVARAGDGTIIEVFEWKSTEAIEQAHENARIRSLWDEFESACEYVPLSSVPEANGLFSEFTPL